MALREGKTSEFLARPLLVRVLIGFVLLFAATLPAQATLLPPGFLDMKVSPSKGAAAVEADRMSYDSAHKTIAAEGNVVLSYQGYVIKADQVDYNQVTGAVNAKGHVTMTDTIGTTYRMDSIEVTGGMKEAFLNSLTLTTAQGAKITARDAHYSAALTTILTDAAYSPCGLCVDSKGRKIGWTVKAARIIYDRKNASVTLEQPSLALLGIPVAWLPWFWVPDPTQARATGLRMPSVNFDAPRGGILTVPYFIPAGEDADIILSPTLMSRQGFLMRGDANWRFPGFGEIDFSASGLYQLDKSAFAGTVGDRSWRGAIQTSGRFTPAKDWAAGWSYSAFSDNAYLSDYADAAKGDITTNQLYASYLTSDTYLDARIQHFNRIGNYTTDDPGQANALPIIKADHIQDLAPGWGRLNLSGEWLGIDRGADQTATFNGVNYAYGLAGEKQHLELEGAWENQWILPGGVTAAPYVGMRLDAAAYNGASAYPGAPPASSLLSATPIAAMDFRWPLMARNGADTHLLEPIAQLVYRGSATTDVGITNDDAQSFVFDETNLFSYNRFSGIDRQETGLRANFGGHYLGNFADGSWLDLVAGESFQLVGPNALGVPDLAQVGTSTGLGSTASYLVAGARGGFSNGITLGAKLQVDPANASITRAGTGVSYSSKLFSAGLNYIYVAANPALGTTIPDHELGGNVSVPIDDYWTATGGLTWDLGLNQWAGANAGLTYDDGYLLLGLGATATAPSTYTVGVHFGLKGPDGKLEF